MGYKGIDGGADGAARIAEVDGRWMAVYERWCLKILYNTLCTAGVTAVWIVAVTTLRTVLEFRFVNRRRGRQADPASEDDVVSLSVDGCIMREGVK